MADDQSFLYPDGQRAVTPEDDTVSWGDYAKGLGAATVNIGTGAAALTDYATGGEYGRDARKKLSAVSDSIMDTTSPAFRRAAGAEVFPGEGDNSVWQEGVGRSIAAKGIMSAPTLIASIIPASLVAGSLSLARVGLAGRVLGGELAARGTAGALNAGDVTSDIYSRLEKLTPEQLRQSDLYLGYLSMGMSENEAREAFMRDAIGYKPIVAGAISMALGGVEGQIGRRMGGEEAKGFLRGAAKGALAEGIQETTESGTGEILGQQAMTEAGISPADWLKVLSKAVEGGAVGGLMGGAAGGASNIGGRAGAKPAPKLPAGVEQVEVLGGDAATRAAVEASQPAQPAATPAAQPETAGPAPTAPTPAAPAGPDQGAQSAPAPGPVPGPDVYTTKVIEALGRKGVQVDSAEVLQIQKNVKSVVDAHTGVDGVQDHAAIRAELNAFIKRRITPPTTPEVATPAAGKLPEQVVQSKEPTVPEARSQLQVQLKDLADMVRAVVMIPEGNTAKVAVPAGMKRAKLRGVGAFVYNPQVVTPAQIKAAAKAGRLNELLGMGDTSKAQAMAAVDAGAQPAAVVVRDGETGIPKVEAASSSATAAADAAQMAAKARPADTVEVKSPDAAMAEREALSRPDAPVSDWMKDARDTVVNSTPQGLKDRIRELHEQGKTAKEIAAEVNMEPTDVRFIRDSLGLEAHGPTMGFAIKMPEDAPKPKMMEATAPVTSEVAVPAGVGPKGAEVVKKAKKAKKTKVVGGREVLAPATEDARAEEKRKYDQTYRVQERNIARVNSEDGTLGKNWTEDQRTARAEDNERADHIIGQHVPTETEGKVFSDKAGEQQAGITATMNRIRLMVGRAKEMGHTIQSEFNQLADTSMEHNAAQVLLNEAAKLATQKKPKPERVREYLMRENMLRNGGRDAVLAQRRAEAEAANRKAAEKANAKGEKVEDGPDVEKVRKTGEALTEKRDLEDEVADKIDAERQSEQPTPEEVQREAQAELERKDALRREESRRLRDSGALVPKPETPKPVVKVERNLGRKRVRLDPKSEASASFWERRVDDAQNGIHPMSDEEARDGGFSELLERDRMSRQYGLSEGRNVRVGGDTGVTVAAIRSGTLWGVLNSMKFDGLKGASRMLLPLIREKILGKSAGVEVHVVSSSDMRRIVGPGIRAFYDKKVGHVVVDEAILRGNSRYASHVVMHEAVHAALSDAIKGVNVGSDHPLAILYEHLLDTHGFDNMRGLDPGKAGVIGEHYGFRNMHEFMSEALSNPQFQEWLGRTPLPEDVAAALGVNRRTYWSALVDMVRLLFRLPERAHSALEGVMRVSDHLMNFGQQFDHGEHPSILPFDARAAMGSATREVGDRATNWAGGLRRFVDHNVKTLGMLARNAREVFKSDVGDRVYEYAKRIETLRQEYMTKPGGGEDTVRMLADAERRYKDNPKQWQEFVDLAHDATIANVNLGPKADNSHLTDAKEWWQAKYRLTDLRKRFDALPPDLQKAMLDANTFFKGVQRDEARVLLGNLIDGHKLTGKLSVADMLAKSLSKERAEELGITKNVRKTLNAARALHSVEGIYFPLMRDGDFVVAGRKEFATPKGATRLDDQTVLFTADKESKALAAARAWAESHELNTSDMKEVYVDPADHTREVSADDLDAIPAVRVRMQDRHVEFVPTEAEARKLEEALKADGLKDVYSGPRKEFVSNAPNFAPSAVRSLKKSVEQMPGYGNMKDGNRAVLARAIEDASLRLMAGYRLQSHRLPRRKVAGYSTDVVQNAARYASSASGYIARLTMMPKLDKALEEMRRATEAGRGSKEGWRQQELYQEMEKRVFADSEPRKPGVDVTGRLLQWSSTARLAGFSFHAVNAAEPLMVGMPVISGRHGMVKATAAITRAYNELGAGGALGAGIRDLGRAFKQNSGFTNYVDFFKGQLRGHANEAGLGAMFTKLHELGLIDHDAGMEVQRQSNAQANLFWRGMDKADLMSRQVGAAVESINRGVVATAAYKLELARTKGNHDAAMRYAIDVVHDSMGDYSRANAPDVFNNGLGRLAFQFKKFPQKMYSLLGRSFKGMLRGDMEMTKQFVGLMVTHGVMAGVLGLPWEGVKLGLIAANTLGATSFDYDDLERWMREKIAHISGSNEAGEAISRGLPRALGVDVSGRMGLESLLTFGAPKSNKDADIKAYLFNTMAGAPIGVLLDVVQGSQLAFKGDGWGAAAKITPLKAGVDIARAVKGTTEGKVSASGRQTLEPYSAREAVTRALGFTPAREAETRERNAAFYQQQKSDTDTRKQIMTDWVTAKPDQRAKLWGAVERYNAGKPDEARVTRKQLDDAVKRRAKEQATGVEKGGIRATNRDRYIRDNLNFYGV